MSSFQQLKRVLLFLALGFTIIQLLRKGDPDAYDIVEGEGADQTSNDEVNGTLEFLQPSFDRKGKRPKACLLALVRNQDVEEMQVAIREVQLRFNDKYQYDWVLLNDEEFTSEFKKDIRAELPNTVVKFGLIPKSHWSYPDFIDLDKAAEARVLMKNSIYGWSESYRHMCRFQSGFFWRHPLVMEYDWYWRIDPDISIHCDINYDIFQWMQDNNKVYGFGISVLEEADTIMTLWNTTRDFFDKNPKYMAKNNLLHFISNDEGKTFNLCHFWSNFEIANLNFYRSPAYRAYFDYLDHAGGFYYERWGDAPIHSIAVALMLPKDRIHHFEDIGYTHPPGVQCPLDYDVWKKLKCDCLRKDDVTFNGKSCGRKYYDIQRLRKPPHWKEFADWFHTQDQDSF